MSDQTIAIVREIVAALATIHEPSTPQNQRVTAMQFCEDLKQQQDPALLFEAANVIIEDAGLPAHTRFFGLQLFEHIAKNVWNTCDEQTRDIMKNRALELLNAPNLLNVQDSSARTLVHKHAAVIVEIAKRDWPQAWDGLTARMDASLKAYIESQGANAEEGFIFAAILEKLARIALTPAPEMPERRRKEVQQGVFLYRKEVLPDIVNAANCAKNVYAACVVHNVVTVGARERTAAVVAANEAYNMINLTLSTLEQMLGADTLANFPALAAATSALPDHNAASQFVTSVRGGMGGVGLSDSAADHTSRLFLELIAILLEGLPMSECISNGAIALFQSSLLFPSHYPIVCGALEVFTQKAVELSDKTQNDVVLGLWAVVMAHAQASAGLLGVGASTFSTGTSDVGERELAQQRLVCDLRLLRGITSAFASVLGKACSGQSELSERVLDTFSLSYLESICGILSANSVQIQTEALMIICDLLKSWNIVHFTRTQELKANVAQCVLEAILSALYKRTFDPEVDAEFETEIIFTNALSTLRSIATTSIPLLVPLHPSAILQTFGNLVVNTMKEAYEFEVANQPGPSPVVQATLASTSDPETQAMINTRSLARVLDPFYVNSPVVDHSSVGMLESLATASEHIFRALFNVVIAPSYPDTGASHPSRKSSTGSAGVAQSPSRRRRIPLEDLPPADLQLREEILSLAAELLSTVLGFQSNELTVMMHRLRLITSFWPLYSVNEEALNAAINALIQVASLNPNHCMDVTNPALVLRTDISPASVVGSSGSAPAIEVRVTTPDCVIEVRRRATFSILYLANTIPDAMYSQLDLITNFSSTANPLTPSEQSYLVEAILAILTGASELGVDTSESIQSVTSQVLQPAFDVLRSEQYQRVMSSDDVFLELLGLNEPEQFLLNLQVENLASEQASNSVFASSGDAQVRPKFAVFSTPDILPEAYANPSDYFQLRSEIFKALTVISSVMRVLAYGPSKDRPSGDKAFTGHIVEKPGGSTIFRSTSSGMASGNSSDSLRLAVSPEHDSLYAAMYKTIVAETTPSIVALIFRAHSLGDDAVLSRLPARLHVLAAGGSGNGMLWILRRDGGLNGKGSTAPPPDRQSHLGRDVASWLDQCCELALQTLNYGTLAGDAFYNLAVEDPQTWHGLFKSIYTAPLRRAGNFLTKFVSAFLLRCPVDYYPTVLATATNGLLNILRDLLVSVWTNWQNRSTDPSVGETLGAKLLRLRGNISRALPGSEAAQSTEGPSSSNAPRRMYMDSSQGSSSRLDAFFEAPEHSEVAHERQGRQQIPGDLDELEALDECDVCDFSNATIMCLAPAMELTLRGQKELDLLALPGAAAGEAKTESSRSLTASWRSPFATGFTPGGSSDQAATASQLFMAQPPESVFCELLATTAVLRTSLLDLLFTALDLPDTGHVAWRATRALRRIMPFILYFALASSSNPLAQQKEMRARALIELRAESERNGLVPPDSLPFSTDYYLQPGSLSPITDELFDAATQAMIQCLRRLARATEDPDFEALAQGRDGASSGLNTAASSAELLFGIGGNCNSLIDECCFLIRDVLYIMTPHTPKPLLSLLELGVVNDETLPQLLNLVSFQPSNSSEARRIRSAVRAFLVKLCRGGSSTSSDTILDLAQPFLQGYVGRTGKKPTNKVDYFSVVNLFEG